MGYYDITVSHFLSNLTSVQIELPVYLLDSLVAFHAEAGSPTIN
jgi:hypothetical protein